MNCVFRTFLRLFIEIMEFEDKQGYKLFQMGVLVWKQKNLQSNQQMFSIGEHYAWS